MIKINWSKSYDAIGNALGYSTHAKMLRAALERRSDVEITEDGSAPISVHIVTPNIYMPDTDRFNVLYTMYEMAELPPDWLEPLKYADQVVVPCSHNQDLFAGSVPASIPVDVCLEGVDVEAFGFYQREKPKLYKFVFLWVGASNPRKGYQYTLAAWARFNNMYPELSDKILLYMKTTQVTENPEHIIGYKPNGEEIREVMDRERVLAYGNVKIDTRKIPFEGEGGLIDMYKKAHCFMFPTMGEGFGLTMAEAMSTGLPVIYTPWSGPVDFCSRAEGYPVKFGFAKVSAVRYGLDGKKITGHSSYAADPDVKDVSRKMLQIYNNYAEALERGKKAAARIRREITWDISAKRFLDVVSKRYSESKTGVTV